jgi:hypothetical protein
MKARMVNSPPSATYKLNHRLCCAYKREECRTLKYKSTATRSRSFSWERHSMALGSEFGRAFSTSNGARTVTRYAKGA